MKCIETAQLMELPSDAGDPETSATRPPSEFDHEALPEFSTDYTEAEYLLSGGNGDVRGFLDGGQP